MHSSVEKIVKEKHQLLVTKFVLPVMAGVSVFVCTHYFEPTPRVLAVIVLGALTAAVNIFLTTGYRNIHFLNARLKNRSDALDLGRWIFNIGVTDTLLAITLPMSYVEFVNFWFFLSVCSFADNFARRFRVVISVFCFVAFFAISWYFFEEKNIPKLLFVAFGIFSFLFIFSKLEKYWIESLEDLVNAEHTKSEIILETEKMRIDAVLGMQSRHISHELGNMIMVIDASVNLMKKSLSSENQAVLARLGQLEKAINYIRKINYLVIDSMKFKAEIRTMKVQEFFDDVEMLFGKDLMSRGVNWTSTLDEKLQTYEFNERSGSMFLIIQNILKNSCESMLENGIQRMLPDSALGFIIEKTGQNEMTVTIKDNGRGMDEATLSRVLRGKMASEKENGHGLGLRFVHSECEKNGFDLSATSEVKVGTEFYLKVPVQPMKAKHELS